MNAILKDDPPDLSSRLWNVQPSLNRLVRRCLEKNPDERFRSAHDVAFALDALSESSIAIPSAVAPPADEAKRARRMPVIAALIVLLLVVGAFVAGRRSVPAADSQGALPASFKHLTFRRGTIRSARFTPDGKSILYGAAWDGEPLRIFVTRPESPESTRFPLPDADILSISSTGELAVSLGRTFKTWINSGTLARAPQVGGSSREVLNGVSGADWSVDGKDLAVIRRVGDHDRIEFPIGKVLLETSGYFSHIRFSPKGDRIALLDHPYYGDDRGTAAVIDLQGKKTTLCKEMAAIEGLAWGANGAEVWYTGTVEGERISLWASDLSGNQRRVLQVPVDLTVHDITPDGRVLLSGDVSGGVVFGAGPGETKERSLSALSYSSLTDITRDGRMVALTEFEGTGTNYSVFIRKTDGSPAIRLGEGSAWGFSPDGQSLLATTFTPPILYVLPTGAGEAKRFSVGLDQFQALAFAANDRIVIIGSASGHASRVYVMNLNDGKPQPITPEGPVRAYDPTSQSAPLLISPDGARLITNAGSGLAIYSLAGEKIAPVPGVEPSDQLVRWAADGKTIFVSRPTAGKAAIFKLDLASGQRTMFRETVPADNAGLISDQRFVITPDGSAYAYSSFRLLSDLYLVEGLK
jgi:Tol biopolymer transport system component